MPNVHARAIPVSFAFTVSTPQDFNSRAGKPHRFQQRTVDKLIATAQDAGKMIEDRLKLALLERYNISEHPGHGKLARSVKMTATGNRSEGVTVQLSVGNFRELQFMTTLVSPNQFAKTGVGPYPIYPRNREFLRFFWWPKHGPKKWVRLDMVKKHPSMGPDVFRQVGEQNADDFYSAVYNSVYDSAVELTIGGSTVAQKRRMTKH
jgi:hypothetical protein